MPELGSLSKKNKNEIMEFDESNRGKKKKGERD
jgi:hypothetical protein